VIGLSSVFACGEAAQPYAQSALQNAVPNPWTSSGQFIGLARFTATELNRTHQGSHWGPITYVSANVASTRPDEISVNPIDDFTWGAVAYSVRAHRCYVIVVTNQRDHPQFGDTFYGVLPKGASCTGTNATRETAKSLDPLPE
jgi:hypothetical protein